MPSSITSRMPPTSVVITARPAAMASRTALEMPSEELVCKKTSLLASKELTSEGGR